MKQTFRILLLTAVLSSAILGMHAQNSGINSPYSRYGWGILSETASGFNKGMAGAGYGMRQGNIINYQNPAAYSEIDSLTLLFDAGISLQNGTYKAGGKSKNAQNSTLDYLAAAFRLGKGLGFSLGLRPYSHIGYDFSSTLNLDDIDGYGSKTSTSTYHGEGGLHLVYAGIGYSPIKNLSVGATAKYIWGDYAHSSSVTNSDNNVFTLTRRYTASLNAATFDFGLQYTYQINKKDQVTLGLTYGIYNRTNQRATFVNMQSGTGTISSDTVNVSNAFQLPTTIGAGLTWNHGYKWIVSADYTLQRWAKCRFPELQEKNGLSIYKVGWNSFKNRQQFALGLQYMPNPRSIKVRDHICYRAGVSYTTPYTKVNGKDGPKSYMATVGVGLPIVNKHNNRSEANISVQYEHCDSKAVSAIKEDYFRLCLGLTFNANWFSKWKVQ